MWTACCTVFFGFLCCSKFTIPSQATFDQEVHLSLADIAVEQQAIPTVVQSNTDPFRQGVQLYLVKMDTALCPVKTMLAYLTTRDAIPGPLFNLANNQAQQECNYQDR